ncbi:hypothetical protein GE061_014734 [Apolygus lucorum]|uniref:Cuticle protein n=1 Tax=Apolygus lucorum TaxID=248454 RepID=A0A8S9XL33_APOLU|nr:hypothetical protein GE061_014734 [Apolygus lucorum]
MKCLVVLSAFLGVSFGQHWGLPQPVHDTPEVAAAKADHLAAVSAAKHGVHYIPQPQHHYAPHHQWEAPLKKWTGPIAVPPGYDKHGAPLPVLDTPEVAAEKSKHFHLYSHGAYAASAARYAPSHAAPAWSHAASPSWSGSVPADTPEVAAAKAAHFAAHAARHY